MYRSAFVEEYQRVTRTSWPITSTFSERTRCPRPLTLLAFYSLLTNAIFLEACNLTVDYDRSNPSVTLACVGLAPSLILPVRLVVPGALP